MLASDVVSLVDLIVFANNALLGQIPSKLRAVSVLLEGGDLYWTCIFDGEPSDEERELLNEASTYLVSDFPPEAPLKLTSRYVSVPSPKSFEAMKLGRYIFRRYENLSESE